MEDDLVARAAKKLQVTAITETNGQAQQPYHHQAENLVHGKTAARLHHTVAGHQAPPGQAGGP
eukprot:3690446-Ditylum_brightwellii.AAC.1